MGSRVFAGRVKEEDMHLAKMDPALREAFLFASSTPLFGDPWYLAGGTALALQVGHRESIDLDFFIKKVEFDENDLERKLLATKKWRTHFREEGTVLGLLLKTKASFIAYPFFAPGSERATFGAISMLMPQDIAAMKIIAISQRGRKRDFVDLYWYCNQVEPLSDILFRAISQYPGQEHNLNHLLRSLVYFEDAEEDPMPKLFFDVSWEEIKRYFLKEVPRATRKFLDL